MLRPPARARLCGSVRRRRSLVPIDAHGGPSARRRARRSRGGAGGGRGRDDPWLPMWWDYPGPAGSSPAPSVAGRDGHDQGSGAPLRRPRLRTHRSRCVRRPRWRRRARAPAPAAATARRARQPDAAAAVGTDRAGGCTRRRIQLASDRSAFSPSFASVGTAMFYHADEAEGVGARPGGHRRRRRSVLRITRIVDDAANNFHVGRRLTASRIAFDSDRDGVRGVYVADADGKHVRRVSGEGYAAVPSWSPDGRTLAFVRAEPSNPKVWNLWTLELESGEMRQITTTRLRAALGRIVVPGWPADRLQPRGPADRPRPGDRAPSGCSRPRSRGGLVRTPAVSPDGRRIVFQVHRDGAWLLEFPSGVDAAGARGPDRRGIHVGAGRQAGSRITAAGRGPGASG